MHLPLRCVTLAGFALCLHADVLTLTNGDRITGTILKKEDTKVTVKTELLGEVTLMWASVASVRTDAPLHVELKDGSKLEGPLSPLRNEVLVEAPGRAVSAQMADVVALRNAAEQRRYERLIAPGWRDLWAGYFDLGFSLARGNAKTDTYTTAMEAVRLTRTDKGRVYFNQIYSNATINGLGSQTAGAVRGGWAYDHNITGRTFFNVFNDYEHDRFQSLDLRFVAGGGAGLHALRRERIILDLLAGASYNREAFSTAPTRDSAEAYWGDDLRLRVNGVTSLNQTFRMFNSLTRTGDYRMNFDLGLATTLRRWLSLQITASDRFLSRPVAGRVRNDVLLTTGFRVTFSR